MHAKEEEVVAWLRKALVNSIAAGSQSCSMSSKKASHAVPTSSSNLVWFLCPA